VTFLCGSYADLNWYSKTVNIRLPSQHVPSATTYWRYVLFLVPEVRDVDPYIFIDMIGKYNAQERGGQIEPIRPLAGAASGPKTKPTVTGTVSAVGLTRRGFGSSDHDSSHASASTFCSHRSQSPFPRNVDQEGSCSHIERL